MAPDRLDRTFAALADPTRRAMLARLSRGGATVTTLAAPFKTSLPAVSKHLKVLEKAGLIRRDIQGREHHCSLEPRPLWSLPATSDKVLRPASDANRND